MAIGKKGAAGSGHIRQRPDGRWEAQITLGIDSGTSKQVRKSIYAKTQKECRKKMVEALAQIDKGVYVARTVYTVKEWLRLWIVVYLTGIKESSRKAYQRKIDEYILPALGAVKISDLRREHIQKFVNDLQARVSPKTVKDTFGILHGSMEEACRSGQLAQNPCDRIKLPKVQKADVTIMDAAQLPSFLQACNNDPYGPLFQFLVCTGCRISEALGLSWKSIDFEKGTLTISQQLENATYKISTTKTGEERTFKPASIVLDLLKVRKSQQDADKKALDGQWLDQDDLVFTDSMGNHYAHNTIRKHLHKILASAGLPDMRVHDLRHCYTVFALAAGDDIKSIQSTLGHSTIQTTLDIYARFSNDLMESSSEKMGDFFGRYIP